jgi:hypothetical protein
MSKKLDISEVSNQDENQDKEIKIVKTSDLPDFSKIGMKPSLASQTKQVNQFPAPKLPQKKPQLGKLPELPIKSDNNQFEVEELPELPNRFNLQKTPQVEELQESPNAFNIQKRPQPRIEEPKPERIIREAPIERTFRESPPQRIISEIRPHNKHEDMYIKLDKFVSAKKALKTAREKLREIEDVMRQIRDTRMREEQELAAWEKDIDSAKVKISEVTKNIFEKIE